MENYRKDATGPTNFANLLETKQAPSTAGSSNGEHKKADFLQPSQLISCDATNRKVTPALNRSLGELRPVGGGGENVIDPSRLRVPSFSRSTKTPNANGNENGVNAVGSSDRKRRRSDEGAAGPSKRARLVPDLHGEKVSRWRGLKNFWKFDAED